MTTIVAVAAVAVLAVLAYVIHVRRVHDSLPAMLNTSLTHTRDRPDPPVEEPGRSLHG